MRRFVAVAAVVLVSGACRPAPARAQGPRPVTRYEAVAEKYLAGLPAIEKKATGMTRERAAAYRKSAPGVLLRRLAKENQIAEDDLRQAVKGVLDGREGAKRRAESESPEADQRRANECRVGMTGTLLKDAPAAVSYFAVQELWTLIEAKDYPGIAKMVEKKQALIVGHDVKVRVIELYDYSKIHKGYFARVRVTDATGPGQEIFCLPQSVEGDR